ncbi:MAG: hypothetical protein HYY93_11190 [Planctomycetes bacterium]|nr:hypothetical protein [Planctomycetota bacterium]
MKLKIRETIRPVTPLGCGVLGGTDAGGVISAVDPVLCPRTAEGAIGRGNNISDRVPRSADHSITVHIGLDFFRSLRVNNDMCPFRDTQIKQGEVLDAPMRGVPLAEVTRATRLSGSRRPLEVMAPSPVIDIGPVRRGGLVLKQVRDPADSQVRLLEVPGVVISLGVRPVLRGRPAVRRRPHDDGQCVADAFIVQM